MPLRDLLSCTVVPLAVASLAHAQPATRMRAGERGDIPTPAPSSLFAYDARAPLAVRDSLREIVDGIAVHELSYDSPKGGRVTGLLYVPATRGRHPAMLLGHGAPGNARGYATMTMGLAMARSGAVTLAIDAPFARRGAEPLTFTPADSADRVQYMIDFRRGLDVLSARDDVDATRLGYIGNSFGGANGAMLAGIEPRLVSVVLRVGDGGFVSHFTEPCTSASRGVKVGHLCAAPGGPLDEMGAAQRERWYRSNWPVEPIHFVGNARGAMLLQNARKDEAVNPASAQRLQDAAPAHAVREWYESGHRLPNEALLSSLRFLQRTLGLSAPDADFERWLAVRTAPAPPPGRSPGR